jgi:diacylglycerol kinase (ATP)
VNRISTEHHPLSGRAKDAGSAAVFMSAVNMAVVWCFILFDLITNNS